MLKEFLELIHQALERKKRIFFSYPETICASSFSDKPVTFTPKSNLY
jgi:hypothetical protein